MPQSYPETLEIQPLTKPPVATIGVPGSKSITNRALVLAALSTHPNGTELHGALESEDTEVMIGALRDLGFRVQLKAPEILHVGCHGFRPIPAAHANLFTGNSGTSMRFLTAMVALGHGRYCLDGISRMRERPIQDLLHALRQLGANAYSENQNGYPPVIVEARGLDGGNVAIRGDISSQFLSGLMMAAPLALREVVILVEGLLVSLPYVMMTRAMMREFGVEIRHETPSLFRIPAPQPYCRSQYAIEPDASAASYVFAAAAITGGETSVPGLTLRSIQGDIRFVTLLADMGCHVTKDDDAFRVKGGPLRGIDVDMNDISDTVMTLAAVACFAEGPTTIRNVAHIRHKETDRLAALATELRKVGAEVDEYPDGLKITPRPLHGAVIDTYNDHRMAMSMALIGLKVPGIVINNPACVAKTYPNFFDDLEKLRS